MVIASAGSARAASAAAVPPPLIELRDIRKSYGGTTRGPDGQPTPVVDVLRGISVSIDSGEFVAIVGASGSGKSTLMHILGCLDRPTSGQYRFAGQDIAGFSADELAWLRREAFGFVFQGYHLIATESARENVEVPAIYSGMPVAEREQRAAALLERLGLGDRLDHRPSQLSGGQQQRVSISRALMNGGHIVLADEPTGALDSNSGAEVMRLLEELAATGHTVILITHDRDVAARAHRTIEVRDGQVVADSGKSAAAGSRASLDAAALIGSMAAGVERTASFAADTREALRAAWRVLWVNRSRTLLTLLGIIIGVASVIVMMAIGAGTERQVVEKMASFGTNRMYVTPGGDNPRGPGGTLSEADADIVREVPNVAAAMPFLEGSVTVRHANVDTQVPLWAVTDEASRVLNWKPARGIFFSAKDEHQLATVVLIGKRVREKLFGDASPIGDYVLVNNVPFQVIGELEEKGATSGDADDDNVILMPFSTGSRRIVGTTNLSWISILIDRLDLADDTARQITQTLETAHHVRDFQVYNRAASVRAQTETQDTLTLMLGLIAAISLLVGGIGVMNIMLMTVRERTREIGIRIATGARQRDILRQFLTEATLVSGVGGGVGVACGLLIGAALIAAGVPAIFSVRAIIGAFGCALLTGLVFGFMPARQAARLDPVVALASE
ncbi:macrolide transport system ATP-binding/permease protein [Paraburkholderia caballeronis]|uniref:MacB family efflux pump subunit n=1 Tax=Paraburkholderia caballeronis TaxID=416943 RepID=UPI0010EE7462|nr:MacB family efflux pump subunit [Paraburkholderia caballeronis]TDV35522.1 macrolide transport system ATP-binding/permease protein [Paraburkholderia caballeronis]